MNCNAAAGSTTGRALTSTDVTVTILTDNYPGQTTWAVTDESRATVMSSLGLSDVIWPGVYVDSLLKWVVTSIVNDSFGDGICCAYGNGSYTV